MGYSINKLREELVQKGYSDGGLIAWGQNSGAGILFGAIGGAISAATRKMHVITMKDNGILIIPFSNREIFYNEAILFRRDKIARCKLSGLLTKTLTIISVSGKSYKYQITQGAGDMQTILNRLGL